MKCTIFYSWQSDLPNKDNRSFIENCIEKAIKKDKLGFEAGLTIAVDRDTKKTVGTPDIAGTIFDKIAKTDIFICDISIINGNDKGRKCPNPNVLLELGYAVRTLGWDRIICFYNLKYGDIKSVPFDLSHRRIFCYNSDNENEKEQPISLISCDEQTIHEATEAFQRQYIESILRKFNGNVEKAAAAAGIGRSGFYKKIDKLGMDSKAFKEK